MLTERNDSGSSTISLNERLDYGLFFAADYRVFLAEGCQASLTSRCIFFPWITDMFSKSWKIKTKTNEKCSSRTFDTCLHEACLPRLLTFSYWQVAALLWENKSIFSLFLRRTILGFKSFLRGIRSWIQNALEKHYFHVTLISFIRGSFCETLTDRE